MKDGQFVGSLDDHKVYQSLVENPELKDKAIANIMTAPFPVVKEDTSIEEVSKLVNKDTSAVLVELKNGSFHIITPHDLISAIA